jgi:DnaJ domain
MEGTAHQTPYDVLQVSPRAHPMIITKAYRLLAAFYHPDNTQTGNEESFKRVAEAYRILSDPLHRAAYDRQHPEVESLGTLAAAPVESASLGSPERRSVDEREVRQLILRALYDVRRGRPYKPSLSLLVLAELFGCSIAELQFTLWYLRGKHLIETVEDSDLAITVEGVDYLECNGLGANGIGPELGIERLISLPPPEEETGKR